MKGGRPPEVRVAEIDDKLALHAFIRGLDLVVNFAGPFVDIVQSVVEMAVAEEIHYLVSPSEG